MPGKVCREMLGIVQEGLVNVRKHSRARHVLVRLGSSDSQWSLTLEDDGKGFPFSGRVTQDELDQMGKGTGPFNCRRTHGRIESRSGDAPGNQGCEGWRGFR